MFKLAEKGKNYFRFFVSARVSVELQIAIETLVSPRFHRSFTMGRRSVLGNRSPNAGFLLVRSESGSSTKVSPKFHYAQARCFATALLRTRDFQGKPANPANSTPSDVTCLCTTTAPSPPQPGTDHDLKVAKPPLSMGQRSATQRNLQLSWKSGEEEIKFRRLMRLRKNV